MPSSRKILLISLFLLLVLGSFISFKWGRKLIGKDFEKSKTANWYKSDKGFDLVTGNGKLISFDRDQGGINILPPNYQEKSKDVVITIRDIKNGVEKNITVFRNMAEFTNIKFIKNKIDGSKLWLTTFHAASGCLQSDKKISSCKFYLYELDIDTGKLQLKKDFSVARLVSTVYPLIHDPNNNIVWIAVEYKDEEQAVFNRKTGKVEKASAKLTDFLNYDANLNNTTGWVFINKQLYNFPIGGVWFPFGIGRPGKIKLADVDKNGDLYVIAACPYSSEQCKENEFSEDPEVGIYRISSGKITDRPTFELLPLFLYFDSLGPGVEITIDTNRQILYLATKTWTQAKPSVIFAYQIDRERTSIIGPQPTKYDDDVRGFEFAHGKLLLGTFNGLGVYGPDNDSWRIVKTDDGIKDNNIDLIDTTNDGVCLRHENKGSSCIFNTSSL